MKIKEIMTPDVITVLIDEKITEVASLLFDKNLTGVPVVDGTGHLVGIVTEYDFISPVLKVHIPTYAKILEAIKRGTNKNKEIDEQYEKLMQISVSQIMTKDVITVKPEDDISYLAELFTSHRINPIPVVDDEKNIVGIISRADLLKLLKWLK